MFDYNSEEQKELSKQKISPFGLNEKCNIESVDFNSDVTGDGKGIEALDINVNINLNIQRLRIFKIGEQEELLDGRNKITPSHPNYERVKTQTYKERFSAAYAFLKALSVSEETIKNNFSKGSINTFEGWSKKYIQTLPHNYKQIPIDLFLEYEWKIKKGSNQTFPRIPKNIKGGIFVCKAVEPVGSWKSLIEDGELKYIDDSGNIHPISKSANFMNSNKGKQLFSKKEDSIEIGEEDLPTDTGTF